MTTPRIQLAQYGDRAKLEKLGSTRVTADPAADVQQMKSMAGGRPSLQIDGSKPIDPVQLAQQMINAGATQQVPTYSPQELEHQQLFERLAIAEREMMRAVRLASSERAGTRTKAYAAMAVRGYWRLMMQVREQTPFFDGV